VLDLGSLDLDEIAEALADQNDYDHCWLIDPRTGSVEFWTRDAGIDGETPVEIDELDLVPIDPLPSYEWYRDMADFAAGVSDDRAGRRLGRAIQGRGAFRRFKDELHEESTRRPPTATWSSTRTPICPDRRSRTAAAHW
jgi:hypothetical protein